MKQALSFFFLFVGILGVQAQNPFAQYGYEPKIATLSQGKYNEFHDQDTVVQIGSVLFNTKSKQIVAFVKTDTLRSEATLEADIVSRWLSPDPLAYKREWLSPYNFVQNNPIIRIDPDGMLDIYSMGPDGQINFELATDDDFDILVTTEDYNQGNLDNGITVNDQSILPELSKTRDVSGYNISSATTSGEGVDDLFNIFMFASNNSQVEWSLFKHSDNSTFTLGTAHDENTAASFRHYGIKNAPTAKVHSHPGIGTDVSTELSSMGYINKNQMWNPSDWSNFRNDYKKNGSNATTSYVYFPNSSRLYNIENKGPAYIRHINNNHKRLNIGKLSTN